MSKLNKGALLTVLLFSNLFIVTESFADPTISTITGTITTSQQIDLYGSNFGTKSVATPLYWNNLDSSTVGQNAIGMITDGSNPTGVISTTQSYSGMNSLYFDLFESKFVRSIVDMGATFPNVYISALVYLDKSTLVSGASWQWKAVYAGSHPTAYTQNDGVSTGFYNNNWWFSDHWANSSFFLYYNGLTTGASASLASDAYPWGSWFRIEYYAKASSVAGATDGKLTVNRLGHSQLCNISGENVAIGNNFPFRYVALGQDLESNYGGSGDLKVYFDDIYIDSTQARVEACDSSTWAARTHCEVQPPVAWDAGHIKINFNAGTFSANQNIFLYVSDSNGVINASGFPVVVGKAYSSMTTPKNLVGNKTVP